MYKTHAFRSLVLFFALGSFLVSTQRARAEDYEENNDVKTDKVEDNQDEKPAPTPKHPARPATPVKVRQDRDRRKYYVPDTDRVDAGIFHVGFAVGGNFYIEPAVDAATQIPTGDYLKDFGAQGGVYFDYDYSELPQNIPLALRGMIGYKYVLGGTHVFAFDGVVRRMFKLSEKANFGLQFGGEAAVWFRPESTVEPVSTEEVIFLPSVIVGCGFDFAPFMVDFKWLINKIGSDSTRMGLEVYFGFRL